MKNKIMDFDPKSKKYPYTQDTASHYLKYKKLKDIKVDKSYPFINKKKSFLFQNHLLRLILVTFGYLLVKIRLGLRVYGKENIKENKKLLKRGCISISNHIHMWDFMAINYAIDPFDPHVLVWENNVKGDLSWFVNHIGGIPIPEDDSSASKVMYKEVKNYLINGGWLHLYAEGSMWELYRYIRPFKTGASQIAYMANKPILPMAFSYRRPGLIRRKIFRQEALLTINIGELIIPDLNHKDKIELTRKCHEEVVKLAGIQNNIYEPIYNNSKKIDY